MSDSTLTDPGIVVAGDSEWPHLRGPSGRLPHKRPYPIMGLGNDQLPILGLDRLHRLQTPIEGLKRSGPKQCLSGQ